MHRDKRRFIDWIRRGFLLRFHMTLVLVGAFVAGLLTTKLLLELNVDVLWFRYLIAVTVAYGVFVGSIRLWLLYVGIDARRRRNESGFDDATRLVDAISCDDPRRQ